VAVGGGDSGRPDEHSGYCGAVRRARPKEVGGQHDVDGLHRIFVGIGGVGAVGLQDGIRGASEARPGHPRGRGGQPRSILGADNQHQAVIPLLDGAMPKFRFPETTLAYFQFVFAAITPLLFLGSVVGRINFKVWLIFVPLWSTFAYSVNAFLVWGGGFWAQPHTGVSSLFSTRNAGLLWRIRNPPGRRHQRVCCSRGDRAPTGPRSRTRRAQQLADSRGWGGHPVVGLERVQRR